MRVSDVLEFTHQGTPAETPVSTRTLLYVKSDNRVYTKRGDGVEVEVASATGTKSTSTFLRGDNTWAAPFVNVTQAAAEAGTETTNRVWTAQRVNQAIQALAPVKAADLTGYSPTSHNHDTAYATTGHTHSGYATTSHDHGTTYAALSHFHGASAINAGVLDILRLPVATDGNSTSTEVVRANDTRLSNARTPVSHGHGKADVGLGNVDNTSDADKPVSSAMALALASKLNNPADSGRITVSGTFAGYIRFVKVGPLVFVVGEITRATGFSTGFTNVGTTAASEYLPVESFVFTAQPFFNAAGSYRFRVTAAGSVELQQTTTTTQTMTVNGFYPAATP